MGGGITLHKGTTISLIPISPNIQTIRLITEVDLTFDNSEVVATDFVVVYMYERPYPKYKNIEIFSIV